MAKEEKLCPIPQPVNAQKLLDGKIALITGGSGGIGFAMAKAFLAGGAKVIIAGTNERKLQDCCEKLINSVAAKDDKNQPGGTDNTVSSESAVTSDYLQYIVLNVLDVKAMPDKVRSAAANVP